MEHEKLEFKIVMDDGQDTEVLGRLAHLDLGAAAFMAAVARYPKKNVYLRQGARIIKQNLGEPKPEPEPPDVTLPDWDVNLIRGKKADFKGTVAAKDHKSAIEVAIEHFKLSGEQVKRLVVNPRR